MLSGIQRLDPVLVFLAGIATFVSPCILPLVPSYLAIISGEAVSLSELSVKRPRLRLVLCTLVFVVGFSLVFSLLGAISGAVGVLFARVLPVFRVLGGLAVVAFGLYYAGAFNIRFLNRVLEPRARWLKPRSERTSYINSFLTGVAFGISWTPCVGAILSSVLLLVLSKSGVFMGAAYLLIYSLGIAVPFLALSLAFGPVYRVVARISKGKVALRIASGVLLVGMGLVILSGWLLKLVGFFARYLGGLSY